MSRQHMTPAVSTAGAKRRPPIVRGRTYGQQVGARARASTNDVNAPASNTAAVITYSANAISAHYIEGLYWSYSGAPAAGNLKIEDGSGTTVFSLDITAAGPGFLPLEKLGTPNTAMIITLAAGGVGISGKVCIGQHWIQ